MEKDARCFRRAREERRCACVREAERPFASLGVRAKYAMRVREIEALAARPAFSDAAGAW